MAAMVVVLWWLLLASRPAATAWTAGAGGAPLSSPPAGGAMLDGETPFAVFFGMGTPAFYEDPVNGGAPGGRGVRYDLAKWGIAAFNRTGKGIGGGMAFARDPGSFPQLQNPICESLGTANPACHNPHDLSAYDPVNGGVPQAPEANLTKHLEHVRGVFSGSVPADFGGICNIDFEVSSTPCRSSRATQPLSHAAIAHIAVTCLGVHVM